MKNSNEESFDDVDELRDLQQQSAKVRCEMESLVEIPGEFVEVPEEST